MAGQNRLIPGNCCYSCDLSSRFAATEGTEHEPALPDNYIIAPGETLELTQSTPVNDWMLGFRFGLENADGILHIYDADDLELATIEFSRDVDAVAIDHATHPSVPGTVATAKFFVRINAEDSVETWLYDADAVVAAEGLLSRSNRSLSFAGVTAQYPPGPPVTAELNTPAPARLVFQNIGATPLRVDLLSFTRTKRLTPSADCVVDATVNPLCPDPRIGCRLSKVGRRLNASFSMSSDIFSQRIPLQPPLLLDCAKTWASNFSTPTPFANLTNVFGDPGGSFNLGSFGSPSYYEITGTPTGNYFHYTVDDDTDPTKLATIFLLNPAPLYWRDLASDLVAVSGNLSAVYPRGLTASLTDAGIYVEAFLEVVAFPVLTTDIYGAFSYVFDGSPESVNISATVHQFILRWLDPVDPCIEDPAALGTRTYRWADQLIPNNFFDSPPDVGLELETLTGFDGPPGNFSPVRSDTPQNSSVAVYSYDEDIGGGVKHQITGRQLSPGDLELEITFSNG